MAVHEHQSYTAFCDECDWYLDGLETEALADDAIAAHAAREHP